MTGDEIDERRVETKRRELVAVSRAKEVARFEAAKRLTLIGGYIEAALRSPMDSLAS